MKKLWSKNKELSKISSEFNLFTTGRDYELDRKYFLKHDIRGTIAHVGTLYNVGILSSKEKKQIQSFLDSLYNRNDITINPDDEDCHTVLEQLLINEFGDLGKKVHTGRSRNDQSLTMIRLFMRQCLDDVTFFAELLENGLNKLTKENRSQVFIGYSHTQQAMLTTLGHYYNAYAEQLNDDIKFIQIIKEHINQNPLGSGAGFGSPIQLDRTFSMSLLDFNKVQNNSLYCQNSRGKFELLFLHSLSQVMITLQRLATDMIMYTTREFSFFDIDDNLAQGSSMMPQKRNLDVFEIIRAKSAEVISLENRVQLILRGLPSGYNRDLQIIKDAIVEAFLTTKECINQTRRALIYLKPNDVNIRKAIKPDIYSADIATINCLEDSKLNFRDEYNKIMELNTFDIEPEEIIKRRKSQGSPGNF